MKLYINITEVFDFDHVQEFAELSATPAIPSSTNVDGKTVTTYAIKWHSSAGSPAGIRRALRRRGADLQALWRGQGRLSGDLYALAFGA